MRAHTHDVWTALAPLLRVRPKLEDYCRFGGGWRSTHGQEPDGWAYFHIVVAGRCVVERLGQNPLRLGAGDILILSHGDAHLVSSGELNQAGTGVETTHNAVIRLRTSVGVVVETELICGRLHFDAPESLVLTLLPDLIVVHAGRDLVADRFRPIMACIREELEAARAGAGTITADLASAMFLMVLRAYFETAAPTDDGLKLLGHPTSARAALAMIRDPVRGWTLDELAAVAASSRAALVRAFRATGGTTPLAFLTDLRLGMAKRLIRASTQSLAQIAAESGYASESAMSRAFHRRYGIRPGSARERARSLGLPSGDSP